jgi:protein SCO1
MTRPVPTTTTTTTTWTRHALAATAAALVLFAATACAPQAAAPEQAAADEATAAVPGSRDHGAADHAAHDHAAHDHGDHAEMVADEPTGYSIYHAQSQWLDQDGQTRPLDSLGGRVQVVAMVYTNCAYACPRMMLDMKRIEGEIPPELRDDVGFVIVTIDPERDTPENLARYARGARLDLDRWTLLHGDDGDILELAALLGIRYRRMANGEFVHSNLLTVLDRDGQIVHRQMGLGTDPAATLDVIRSILG